MVQNYVKKYLSFCIVLNQEIFFYIEFNKSIKQKQILVGNLNKLVSDSGNYILWVFSHNEHLLVLIWN